MAAVRADVDDEELGVTRLRKVETYGLVEKADVCPVRARMVAVAASRDRRKALVMAARLLPFRVE